MLLLKLLQSLVKTLHSDGTPAQIAAGIAIGSALGLTPPLSAHNLVILALLVLLNVSFGSGLLAMALFAPLGFMLDPLFHRIGHGLLIDSPALRPLWTTIDNTPVLALAGLTNTVVVGSLVVWFALLPVVYLLARVAVLRYRATLGARVRETRLYHAIVSSQVYNVYRWFQP